MYARHVSMHLKPNSVTEFTTVAEKELVPFLRKQKGFQEEISFAIPGGTDVIAISLWDTKENAEAYNMTGYPELLKKLTTVLDGTPKVRVSEVINSTFPQRVAQAA